MYILMVLIKMYIYIVASNKQVFYYRSKKFCCPETGEFFNELSAENLLQEIFKILAKVVVSWKYI